MDMFSNYSAVGHPSLCICFCFDVLLKNCLGMQVLKGVYIGKDPPPGGKKSVNVIWGKKYEKGEEKKMKM
jgi:hypothetical protein